MKYSKAPKTEDEFMPRGSLLERVVYIEDIIHIQLEIAHCVSPVWVYRYKQAATDFLMLNNGGMAFGL